MNFLTTVSLSAVCLLLTTHCGRDDSKNAKETTGNALREHKILGTWESSCKSTKLLGLSTREFYRFTANDLKKATEFYPTADCTQPSVRIQYEGKFQVSGVTNKNQGSKDLDLDYQKVFITPLSDGGVSALNAVHFCEHSDWKIDGKADLTAVSNKITCPIEHAAEKVFEIVRIEDSKLFFGTGKSKVDAANRPLVLNRDTFLTGSHHNLD